MVENLALQNDRVVPVELEIGSQLDPFAVVEAGVQVAERNPRLDGQVELRKSVATEFREPRDIEAIECRIAGPFPGEIFLQSPLAVRKKLEPVTARLAQGGFLIDQGCRGSGLDRAARRKDHQQGQDQQSPGSSGQP